MTLHRIKLKELDSQYIQQLQALYPDKEAEVEIWITENQQNECTEDMFWNIIGLFDWQNTGDDEAVMAKAVQKLSTLPKKAITDFYDLLAEKLYFLDGRIYAENSTDDGYFSADLFLYARCAVVSNGRKVYEDILKNPILFPKDLYFEALLNLPHKAWLKKTGENLQYSPRYVFETGFNVEGWGEESIVL
ncbi:MAG: DUF4240 domain-containing protein [Chitinophagales bacterium]